MTLPSGPNLERKSEWAFWTPPPFKAEVLRCIRSSSGLFKTSMFRKQQRLAIQYSPESWRRRKRRNAISSADIELRSLRRTFASRSSLSSRLQACRLTQELHCPSKNPFSPRFEFDPLRVIHHPGMDKTPSTSAYCLAQEGSFGAAQLSRNHLVIVLQSLESRFVRFDVIAAVH